MAKQSWNPIAAVKETISNRYAAWKAKNNTMKSLTQDLPSTVMGNNYNTAYKKVKEYYDKGDIKGARGYVKGQLQKIKQQSAGTITEKHVDGILSKKYKY